MKSKVRRTQPCSIFHAYRRPADKFTDLRRQLLQPPQRRDRRKNRENRRDVFGGAVHLRQHEIEKGSAEYFPGAFTRVSLVLTEFRTSPCNSPLPFQQRHDWLFWLRKTPQTRSKLLAGDSTSIVKDFSPQAFPPSTSRGVEIKRVSTLIILVPNNIIDRSADWQVHCRKFNAII